MAYKNGYVPADALTTVQPGAQLYDPVANAWYALKAAAKRELGRNIAIAGKGGAYRPWKMQDQMHAASLGTAAQKRAWDLNPYSSVPLASAGYSSHGFGTRVDIVGTPIDAAFIALARKYGFTLEFPGRDPNHFKHDLKTAIKDPAPVKAPAKPAPKPTPAKAPVKKPAAVKVPGKAVQTQKTGDITPAYNKAMHYLAYKKGGLPADRIGSKPLSADSLKHFQKALGVPQTGRKEMATVRAMQRRANASRWVQVKVDGIEGPFTRMGFAAWLNNEIL